MLIKYKYKPIEAYQWLKNGDHPRDLCDLITPEDGPAFMSEGKMVRRFNHPQVSGDCFCQSCGEKMFTHGFIDQGEAGIVVCPGDWVVNDRDMIYDAYPDYVFKADFVEDRYNPLKAFDKLLSDGKTKTGFFQASIICGKYSPNDYNHEFAACQRKPHTEGPCGHHDVDCPGVGKEFNGKCRCWERV